MIESSAARSRVPSRGRWMIGATALAALGMAGGLAVSTAGAATTSTTSTSGSSTPAGGAVTPAHPKRALPAVGLVATASPTSLSVTTLTGATRTFVLNSGTTVREGRSLVGASALTAGTHVAVRVVQGSSPTDPTASKVIVLRPSVGGRVVSVSGSPGSQTIVVRPLGGLDVTVKTSSATQFHQGRQAVTAPTIAVGDVVAAVGQVDSSHTALDATRLLIRPTSSRSS